MYLYKRANITLYSYNTGSFFIYFSCQLFAIKYQLLSIVFLLTDILSIIKICNPVLYKFVRVRVYVYVFLSIQNSVLKIEPRGVIRINNYFAHCNFKQANPTFYSFVSIMSEMHFLIIEQFSYYLILHALYCFIMPMLRC